MRDAERDDEEARGDERERPADDRVARGELAAHVRHHDEPRTRVVTLAEQRDRDEVGDLPQEEDAEEDDARRVDVTGARGPAEERRDRARDRADVERVIRVLLQRGVGEHVEEVRDHREERRQRVRADREDRHRDRREDHAGPEGDLRRETTRGERPVLGPVHPAIDVALDVHVEHVRARDDERSAEQRREHGAEAGADERHPLGP